MNDYVAFYLTTRDDFCLKESCESLLGQGVKNFLFCVPETYWNGDPVTYQEYESVAQAFEFTRKRNDVWAKLIRVHPKMFPSEKYLDMETKIRNHCLKYLEQRKHILIVDGDELWRRGTLEKLDAFIQKENPIAVTMDELLVAGFPGYPIVAKQEGLLVYVQSTATFEHGRTTKEQPKYFDYLGLFHFTSTRRTREDTINKHRHSGHYGDPDYDFDKWMKEKLPKLSPGEKDCHMYKPYQIWERMRYFTKIEWEEIPESLKSYLGKPV